MKIEKLNEDKIRITLDTTDLLENNIDFHSFMSNSIDSQSIFLDMLAKAEEEVGFDTKDYRIMIEAIATSEGNFILTATRIIPEIEKKKKLKIYRKSNNLTKGFVIYEFKTFDDFCDFCKTLNLNLLSSFQDVFTKSKLYLYNSCYYLVLKNINPDLNSLKYFSAYITEFAVYVHKPNLFNKKLSEYGKPIIKKNAINTCIGLFAKKKTE